MARLFKPSYFQTLSPSRTSIINLGCARNLVDAQKILKQLSAKGHTIVDPRDAETLIINTCAFIDDAKKETIDAILDGAELKRRGKIKRLIVAGCFAKRYEKEIFEEFEGVDAVVDVQPVRENNFDAPRLLTPPHFAYLKICESCFHQCSFCVIPQLKGRFQSRSMRDVLREVKELDAGKITELNIIGQDISAYGMDLYKKPSLAGLLKKIVKEAKHISWIRLLYTYPSHITDELIDVIAAESKICKYLDMPLQHINNRVLKAMNRRSTHKQVVSLIRKLRRKIPGLCLRTSFIVGFPGETKEEFAELLSFVKEMKFEKVGVFKYSKEEGTKAAEFPDQVSEDVKQKRYDRLMKEQQKISQKIQKQKVGGILPVMIEEKLAGARNDYLGRTAGDAPEVDGLVYVRSEHKALEPGQITDVNIQGALEYDLTGEAV